MSNAVPEFPPIGATAATVPGGTVTFLPFGASVRIPAGRSLLDAAHDCGVPMPSLCGGRCVCMECRIIVEHGREHVNPVTVLERSKVGDVFAIMNERLACQTTVTGDVTVTIAPRRPRKEKPPR